MDWATFYGIATGVVMLIALFSNDHVIQKLALVLLGAWSLSNLSTAILGVTGPFNGVAMFAPTIEVAAASIVAVLGYANKSRTALAVFVLYGFMLGIHLSAWVSGRTGEYGYFALINSAFMLQLLVVGGEGAWMAIRLRLPRGGERYRPIPIHRSRVEEGG